MPGGHCDSTPRVQQPELKGRSYGEAMSLALSYLKPGSQASQVHKLQAVYDKDVRTGLG